MMVNGEGAAGVLIAWLDHVRRKLERGEPLRAGDLHSMALMDSTLIVGGESRTLREWFGAGGGEVEG